jgi:putative spermidine/putrescine transport system substrate-binding protein
MQVELKAIQRDVGCDTFHADDEEYFSKVRYWTTPISACLDGRTDVACTDYADWTKAWTEIRNS